MATAASSMSKVQKWVVLVAIVLLGSRRCLVVVPQFRASRPIRRGSCSQNNGRLKPKVVCALAKKTE